MIITSILLRISFRFLLVPKLSFSFSWVIFGIIVYVFKIFLKKHSCLQWNIIITTSCFPPPAPLYSPNMHPPYFTFFRYPTKYSWCCSNIRGCGAILQRNELYQWLHSTVITFEHLQLQNRTNTHHLTPLSYSLTSQVLRETFYGVKSS